jgi:hypothetical protein
MSKVVFKASIEDEAHMQNKCIDWLEEMGVEDPVALRIVEITVIADGDGTVCLKCYKLQENGNMAWHRDEHGYAVWEYITIEIPLTRPWPKRKVEQDEKDMEAD